MDTQESRSDDLSDLEQRLAAWKPTAQGLKYEDMLFAAGRASGPSRRVSLAWPVASACLTIVSVVLGVQLASERAERLALLRQLDQRVPETAVAVKPADVPVGTTTQRDPESYLSLQRTWEKHPDGWTKPTASGKVATGASSAQPRILRAWQPEGPLEPL
jgi:hypothetical protein